MKEVKIGLIGFGTIGTGVVKTILQNGEYIRERTGIDLRLERIADLDIKTDRGVKIPENLLTTDATEIIDNPSIDIVIELIGGIKPAKEFIINSLRNGKRVVTANKALISQYGEEIFAVSRENKVPVAFEASVGGGIPIINSLISSYNANNIRSIYGIINGTCNYILTAMEKTGKEFNDILKEAQENGYAEANPTLDVDGIDSAHKLAIMAKLAYGQRVNYNKIFVEGIRNISPMDINFAKELGYKIKLLAIAKKDDKNENYQLRVHPVMINEEHLLAKIDDVYNAIYLEGDIVGPNLLYGQGAGMMATASAVVSDVINLSKNIGYDAEESQLIKCSGSLPIVDIESLETSYYIRLMVIDKPGVLGKIAGILGENNISIGSMIQPVRKKNGTVPIVLTTHKAVEGDLVKAIEQLNKLDIIKDKIQKIRIENDL